MFLAIKDSRVGVYYSQQQVINAGAENALEITPEAWDAAERVARIVDGEIALGRTEAEKEEGRAALAVARIDRELAEINAKQARSSAEIAEALAMGGQPPEESVAYHLERQERARQLRTERKNVCGRGEEAEQFCEG